jgi:hypothetical protein
MTALMTQAVSTSEMLVTPYKTDGILLKHFNDRLKIMLMQPMDNTEFNSEIKRKTTVTRHVKHHETAHR